MNHKIIIFIVLLALSAMSTVYCIENNDSSILPEVIYFRTNHASYNSQYYFILRNGAVLFKINQHLTGRKDSWKELSLPKDLKNPIALSVDDENLIIQDSEKQLFTMHNGLNENPADFKWRKKWGSPFWLGFGFKLEEEYIKWDVSFISPITDQYILYPNGNKHDVGIGCTSVFLLQKNGRRITFIDPWLVNDLSNEITTPQRGEFKAVNMSASGSRLFVINSKGDMYTLLFDFDIAGMDDLFFNYSYHPEDWEHDFPSEDVVPRSVPRPLPIAGWIKEPGVPGKATDQITIIKNGKGANNHVLVVEGIQDGKTGYFIKRVHEDQWHFEETGHPLIGVLLNPEEAKAAGSPLDRYCFQGKLFIDGVPYQAVLSDFNPYSFYSTLILSSPKGDVELKLHHNGTIRLFKRERGLLDSPLDLRGAIEGANNIYGSLKESIGDYKEVKIQATIHWITIKGDSVKGRLTISN